MKELKPCAYCGSKNIDIHAEEPEDGVYSMYWVVCDNCGKGDTIPSGLRDEAIKEWNTRYEPTCKRVEGGKKYGSIKWVCSECGYGLGDKRHNYCPNCGRVIEE